MKRALFAFALVAALPGGTEAGPMHTSLLSSEPGPHVRPPLSFTLVADSQFGPDPVYHSGIVTRAEIAPNASLGLGVVRSRPKKPSGEWNLDNGAPRSRKGLVSFLLKF